MAAQVVVAERGSRRTGYVDALDDPCAVPGNHGVDRVEDDAVYVRPLVESGS